MQTKNMTLFSIEGMTIYCAVRRDGGLRYRNKMKTYNERYRIKTNEWRKDHPEAVIIHRHKSNEDRKDWGCVPINKKFDDSVFHHLHVNDNRDIGIYVPIKIHRPHHSHKDSSILELNKKAIEWFSTQSESTYSAVFAAIVSY